MTACYVCFVVGWFLCLLVFCWILFCWLLWVLIVGLFVIMDICEFVDWCLACFVYGYLRLPVMLVVYVRLRLRMIGLVSVFVTCGFLFVLVFVGFDFLVTYTLFVWVEFSLLFVWLNCCLLFWRLVFPLFDLFVLFWLCLLQYCLWLFRIGYDCYYLIVLFGLFDMNSRFSCSVWLVWSLFSLFTLFVWLTDLLASCVWCFGCVVVWRDLVVLVAVFVVTDLISCFDLIVWGLCCLLVITLGLVLCALLWILLYRLYLGFRLFGW